jgi:hypothetical protein
LDCKTWIEISRNSERSSNCAADFKKSVASARTVLYNPNLNSLKNNYFFDSLISLNLFYKIFFWHFIEYKNEKISLVISSLHVVALILTLKVNAVKLLKE